MKNDKIIIGAFLACLLAAYTLVIFNFFSADEGSRRMYLILVGAPFAVVFLMLPRMALVVLGLLVYSVDWLMGFWAIIPREATWLVDILIGVFIVRTLFHRPFCKHPRTKIETAIFAILGFSIISAIYNQNSYLMTFFGLRIIFRYLFLFLAVYHLNLPETWIRKFLLYFLFAVAVVQTIVVPIQSLVLGYTINDDLSGTFGPSGTPSIAIFFLILISFLASKMIEEHKVRSSYVVLIMWMSITPFLGECKFYFLFMPFLAMFMFRAELFRRPVASVAYMLLGLVLLVVVNQAIVATGVWPEGRDIISFGKNLPNMFKTEYEKSDVSGLQQVERTYTLVNAVTIAYSTPSLLILGAGPGTVTRSVFNRSLSPKTEFYANPYQITSDTSTFAYMMTEYGYVGYFLFMYLLYLVFKRGRILRESPDIRNRIYGRVLESMVFLFAVWCIYCGAWQEDTQSYVFWSLAAMFVALSYRVEHEMKTAQSLQRIQEARSPEIQSTGLSTR